MRFLILLIFGGMGAGLLYLGWSRYQTATDEVNTWPKADGVVAGADDDGYTVQYQVAGEEFVASGARWFGWPKVKDGERLAVVYDPAVHGRGRIAVWQEIYQETALILMFAAIGLFLGVGGYVFMGGNSLRADEVVTAEQMGVVAEYERPVSMSLGEAVELRHPANSVVMMGVGAVVAFLMAMALFRGPDILFTKWLSWPAAAVAFVAGVMISFAAYEQKTKVLRADLNGLREESRWSSKEAAWTQVGKVVRLKRTHREYSQTMKRYSTRTVGYTWVLSDRNGEELIKIDEEMEPREALQRLLRYIPGRTGLAVEERTE